MSLRNLFGQKSDIQFFTLSDSTFTAGSIYRFEFEGYPICAGKNHWHKERIDKEVNVIADFLKKNPNLKVELSNHTGQRGSEEYNLKLSQRKAEILRTYIIEEGVNEERIVPKGYGETEPILTQEQIDNLGNKDGGYKVNRRYELKILEI